MEYGKAALNQPLVITGCGVVSSIGIGFAEFARGIYEERSGRHSVQGRFQEPLPFDEACVADDFDVARHVGAKGTRYFDRTTGFIVSACGMAMQHAELVITDDNREQVGIAIGTSTGSIKSICDFTRDTLIGERPYSVNPILFPNLVMNSAAGQAAIWHRIKGANGTVAGGQLSGLLALRYAALTIRREYADTVIAGAVEEFCPYTAWGVYHAGIVRPGGELALGEGAAMFVLERADTAQAAGRAPLAEVLSCEVATYADLAGQAALAPKFAECIRRALERAAVDPAQVWLVADSFGADVRRDEVESTAIRQALGREPAKRLTLKKQIGETLSAAGAFQLAGAIALMGQFRGDQRIALITSIGRDGMIGCAVIRSA
ncbi:MAG TPA: beta-ketoacyl synthase N-terminal-like domain-containing protein [Symbiobacteriaceae bacterium]|jgi:3-oxoacyl-[acyl-carrier-protein] synthase II